MIYTKIREKLNEIFRKRKTHTHTHEFVGFENKKWCKRHSNAAITQTMYAHTYEVMVRLIDLGSETTAWFTMLRFRVFASE